MRVRVIPSLRLRVRRWLFARRSVSVGVNLSMLQGLIVEVYIDAQAGAYELSSLLDLCLKFKLPSFY